MTILFFGDIFWSLAALWVDWPKLATIPVWSWVFVTVCPIYPILLAIVWFQIIKKKKSNQYLLAFATLPSMVFGVLALIYYPSQMYFNGFNWQDFGQIFWVLFYSIQGWYLFFKFKFKLYPIILVLAYLIAKFSIDYFYRTFDYLAVETLPNNIVAVLFTVALIFSVGLSVIAATKNKR